MVAGRPSDIERFLEGAGLIEQAQRLDLGGISRFLKMGADALETVSEALEQSAMYLKLTPESAQRLKDAGGLMKTKTKGISHAMLGKTGDKSMKWLQVEDGLGSLVSNPAVLSGLGGVMSQLAQQSEAAELKQLLVRIDDKLDDVLRHQRDQVLAKVSTAADAIEEAMTIRTAGGDPRTLWEKVSAASMLLFNAQNDALLALRALADKVDDKTKTGELKRTVKDVERQAAIQLAVLARCFELQDEFRVLELDHVADTAPGNLAGHREGVSIARDDRRARVLQTTEHLLSRLERAGAVANDNIVLHVRAARSVIDSANSTVALVEEFHAPLSIVSDRSDLVSMAWRDAVRDPEKVKTAAKEVAQKSAAAGGVAATAGYAAMKLLRSRA